MKTVGLRITSYLAAAAALGGLFVFLGVGFRGWELGLWGLLALALLSGVMAELQKQDTP
jgi:hypothetical protein